MSATVMAQGAETGMLKIRSGFSKPLGAFGKNTGTLDYSGFVTSGVNFGFEGVYYFSDYAGFGGLINYNASKIDEERLIGAYINSNINYDTAFVNVNPFRSVVAMFGIYYDFPVSNFMAFTFKMMAGSLIVNKPSGTITVRNNVSSNISITETSNLSSKFGIYIGVGMRFNPGGNWNLTTDLEYIGSKVDFVYEVNGSEVERTNYIKLLTFSIGLAYFIE